MYNRDMENNVIQLEYNGKTITLIPTAHVSKDSALKVEEVIDEIKPDSICIELDEDRYKSLTEPDKYRNTDVVKIIKEKKTVLFLVNLVLANYQKRLANQLDSQSGNEMLVGIKKAEEYNATLVLADRNIQTTFKRVWANLNFKDKFNLISMVIEAAFDDEEISEEELASLQQTDILNEALDEVAKEFPHITEPLVDERDKYLAYKIKNAPGTNIVAILGAAHTINVPKYIEEDYEIDSFDVVPPKKTSSKIVGWIIPVIIIVLILLAFNIDPDTGIKQIKTWIIFNGSFAAIGALLGGGHILTILTSFVVAPLTSLNPLLGAGWFAGLVQARISKPTVDDFNHLSEDCNSLKGFYHNKVTRVLLIVLLASLGSSIGTFVSGFSIFASLIDIL